MIDYKNRVRLATIISMRMYRNISANKTTTYVDLIRSARSLRIGAAMARYKNNTVIAYNNAVLSVEDVKCI